MNLAESEGTLHASAIQHEHDTPLKRRVKTSLAPLNWTTRALHKQKVKAATSTPLPESKAIKQSSASIKTTIRVLPLSINEWTTYNNIPEAPTQDPSLRPSVSALRYAQAKKKQANQINQSF